MLGGGARVGTAGGAATAAGLLRAEVGFIVGAGVGTGRAFPALVVVDATGAGSAAADRGLERSAAVAAAAGFVAAVFVGRAT